VIAPVAAFWRRACSAMLLKAEFTPSNPTLRFGRPDEFARGAAFLAFDATFTTAAELAVGGGHSQL
jgi:NAD(P)-dependent dehydrogenase (short-subunit alcohol dehydrogenase family)